MATTATSSDLASLPLAPRNPLPYLQRVRALRASHTGMEMLRDAGGPVTRFSVGPKWLMSPIVVAASPRGARDVLGRTDAFVDKELPFYQEPRWHWGPNLFNLPHADWLPLRRALQPVFTKQCVREFGGHMADAAESVCAEWRDDTELDLDKECRRLTMRALGRSILGLDLDGRADELSEPFRVSLEYVANRAWRPLRAPKWLPTPARHRARRAMRVMRDLAADILQACRHDPTVDAPLVHALIAAADPATGNSLTDKQICDELVLFLVAGHDTTATVLTYALWALGHSPRVQQRVADEVLRLGDRRVAPEDVANLDYTVRVLHEAMRLFPPGPAVARLAMKDIEVDGYRVEAGTMIVIGIYAIQRDPTLWDDPLRFDPDRFSPEQSKRRDRWQYLPFGGGPRSCIGDHFAMLEAAIALATVVRNVEIQSWNSDFPLAVPFTMVAGDSIPGRIRRRC